MIVFATHSVSYLMKFFLFHIICSIELLRTHGMLHCSVVSVGKPRGLRTGRKLRIHRREQKWHDKAFKKAHLGTALKANPFGGASHAKGIVLEKV